VGVEVDPEYVPDQPAVHDASDPAPVGCPPATTLLDIPQQITGRTPRQQVTERSTTANRTYANPGTCDFMRIYG
jgi:hypothetical protein